MTLSSPVPWAFRIRQGIGYALLCLVALASSRR